jgi:Domain of unknown function (DUF4932)
MIIPALTVALLAQTSSQPKIEAKVHPGMEVIAITMWLAGQYPSPTDSPYKIEVWNHFRKFKNHPAIIALKTAKSMYTDFTAGGELLVGWPKPHYQNSPKNDENWRGIMGRENFDAYFRDLPDFVEKSKFWTFFQAHKTEYARYAKEFLDLAKQKKVVSSMEDFYRYGDSRPRPKFEIFLEPLNSWGAHAIVEESGLFPTGVDSKGLVQYQIGYWSSDASNLDQPISFQGVNSVADVAWHEGSHVYLAPVFTQYKAEITKSERLFNRDMLTSQNIATWEYCLNENVVRAVTAVLVKLARGEKPYLQEVTSQVKRAGFIYTKEIAELILTEYVGNKKYANFDAFFPVILRKLETLPDYKGGLEVARG